MGLEFAQRLAALDAAVRGQRGCLACGYRVALDDVQSWQPGLHCPRCHNHPLAPPVARWPRVEAPARSAVVNVR